MRVFGWIWVALGVMGIIGVICCKAWWHLYTVVLCVVMTWVCFREGREDAQKSRVSGKQ